MQHLHGLDYWLIKPEVLVLVALQKNTCLWQLVVFAGLGETVPSDSEWLRFGMSYRNLERNVVR